MCRKKMFAPQNFQTLKTIEILWYFIFIWEKGFELWIHNTSFSCACRVFVHQEFIVFILSVVCIFLSDAWVCVFRLYLKMFRCTLLSENHYLHTIFIYIAKFLLCLWSTKNTHNNTYTVLILSYIYIQQISTKFSKKFIKKLRTILLIKKKHTHTHIHAIFRNSQVCVKKSEHGCVCVQI